MWSIIRYPKSIFDLVSICTREDSRTDNPVGFTPDVEDEFISEAVEYKLDRTLVNTSNKVWRDSTQAKDGGDGGYKHQWCW